LRDARSSSQNWFSKTFVEICGQIIFELGALIYLA